MLKKLKKIMAFLLTLAIVLSLTVQLGVQTAAQNLETEDDADAAVPAADVTLPEEVPEADNDEEGNVYDVFTDEEIEIDTEDTGQPDAEQQNTADSQLSVQSVYVITDPEEHYTATYRFYDEDNILIEEQILSAGEKLQEPEVREKAHKKFTGWYLLTEEGKYVKFEDFDTEEPEMTQSRIIDLYAKYEEVYYVYYKESADPDSKVIYTQTYKHGEEISASEVPFSVPQNYALTGWTNDLSELKPKENLKIQDADVILYPVLKEAKWLTFDTQGGTVTDPQYVLVGQETEEPAEPKKSGYQFDGWYTEEDGINLFSFGDTLEEDIVLYAKWSPVLVAYTVVYWQENADDDGYSFKESVQKQGLTGSQTQASADKVYEGFSVSTKEEKSIKQQTIEGDGSTIVHVYYDRNIYSVYFKEKNIVTETVIEKLTIEAKYGANISSLWPSKRYPDEYDSIWLVKQNYSQSIYQAGIETMPLNGAVFYKISSSGTKYQADYYTESLSGEYVLDHSDIYQMSGGKLVTTEEDYYEIRGFTVKMSGNPSSPAIGTSASAQDDFVQGVIGWKFYYTRNSYDIEFHNGDQPLVTKTYKYEEDISDAGYTPEVLEGKEDYVFAGWYENELGTGDAYDFTDKTMPSNNLILYAKWIPVTYKVSFDLNGALAEEQEDASVYQDQVVEKGMTAEKPADPKRDGYTFTGWLRNGQPFHFNTQIVEDTVLTAQWSSEAQYTITYDPNGGLTESGDTAEPVADTEKYADDALAKVLESPSGWLAPQEDMVFLGWSESADGTGARYYAGDAYLMSAKDVTLYAVWGQLRKTTLTYDYMGGTDSLGEGRETVLIAVPNAKYQIDRDGNDIKKAGYYFIGWSTTQEGDSENLLQKGDSIQVDTLEPETNVLYACWEEEPPTPTGIAEDLFPFAVMVLSGIVLLFMADCERKFKFYLWKKH